MKASEILRRWIALDAALAGPGLDVDQFARRFGVSEKTVYRDLDEFRKVGQRVDSVRKPHGYPRKNKKGYFTDTAPHIYVWTYDGRQPLFVLNLR